MFPKKTTFILFLTVFIDMMGFSIIFPVFPEILQFFQQKQQDFTLKLFQSILLFFLKNPEHPYYIVLLGGLTGSLYAFLQFLFAPLWGKISDRTGRKPILILTSIGNLFGYLAWLFSDTFTLFVLSRLITGCMGGNISVASAAMADITPKEKRASGMGLIGAGIGLGFLFGPPLGGIFAHLPSFLPTNITLTIFPNSALLSNLFALLNLLLIIYFFKETHTQRDPTPLIHPVLMIQNSNKKVLLISLIYFLFTLGFSGMEFSINFFFHDILHFTPRQIGFSFVYMGLIIILVQGGVVRKISGKIQERDISILGSILLVIGFINLSLSKTPFFTFVSLSFLSFGGALLNPSLSSLVSIFTKGEDQGKTLGMFRGLGSLARSLSPIVFSILYFQFGPDFGFITSGILSVIVLTLLWLAPKNGISHANAKVY